MMTTEKPDPLKRRRKLVPRLTVAAVVLLPLGAFLAFNAWIDSGELSTELFAPPREIVSRAQAPEPSVGAGESVEAAPIEVPPDAPEAEPEQSAAPNDEPQEPPTHFASYKDFLRHRLETRPDYKAALLYLELAERNELERFDRRLSMLIVGRNQKTVWRPGDGPIPAELAAWLRSNRELVDLAFEFSRSGTLPQLDRSVPEPAYRLFQSCAWILSAEGRARLEAQDYEGAKTYYLALFRLARSLVGRAHYYSEGAAYLLAGMGLALIEEWLRTPGFGPADKREIAEEMARVHRAVFAGDTHLRSGVRRYLLDREGLVVTYETPWWQLALTLAEPRRRDRSKYFWDVQFMGFSADLPKPIPWTPRLLGGMSRAAKFKRGFAGDLESFDRHWTEDLDAYALDFASLKSPHQDPRAAFADSLFPDLRDIAFKSNLKAIHTWRLRDEARFNLVRAALALSADPELIDGRRAARTDLRRTDPWRDPFSGLGLRINDSGSSETLIYSLGPDLVDQRGLESYDRIRGTISPGDIVLSLPKANTASPHPNRSQTSAPESVAPSKP